ncbi:MAG TPA: dCTP deaminase, partial [Verrucomicrobiae bacterium]|nr:dCTP deaminase [Verrucomicrobiae bacterium]
KMILPAQQIVAHYKKGDILIAPFDEDQVQAASYDLRVGEQGATTTGRKLVNIKEVGYLAIEPGDFAILITLEELKLGPQYSARFGLRSKYARKGLIATTGPQVDPGYHGRLIIGLTNLTPKSVTLPYKDDLLTVEFHKLEEATTKPYTGPYQGKMELGAEEIEAITQSEGMALSEMITTLRSLSANVGKLSADMTWMKWVLLAGVGILALGIAIIGILVELRH